MSLGSIRVNVGCGRTAIHGWLNLDNSLTVLIARTPFARLLPANPRAFAREVRKQNIRWGDAKRLPLGASAAEVVYSSHMIEHLTPRQAKTFLAEAKRVLRPGGIVRLVVPDLRLLVDDYLASGDADRFVANSLLCAPLDTPLRKLSAVTLGQRHHQWIYDGPSLARALEGAGFVEARSLPAGETRISNPGDLDLRERECESAYVEAVRP